MKPHLLISCFSCGKRAYVGENMIDRPEYKCEHCGKPMSKPQWHRAKVTYYVSEELLRQASALLGDEQSAIDICAFDVVCCGPNGQAITFDASCQVKANPKDMAELELMGVDVADLDSE